MPTKRKGASKHRQSRRSRRHSRRHRHSRRSVRGGMFRWSKSSEPTYVTTYVKNTPFKLIGIKPRTDLRFFTGNIYMKGGNEHYLPNGFVFWQGDDEAHIDSGWYQVKKFDPITNMPEGRAYRVDSPENPVRTGDFEVFNPPPPVTGPQPRFLHP